MVLRLWRGRTTPAHERHYIDYFRETVIPELREIDGFLGASLLRGSPADLVEFLVVTRWASLDAVRAFAGDHLETAVVHPAAAAMLVDYDSSVRHYDLVEEVS